MFAVQVAKLAEWASSSASALPASAVTKLESLAQSHSFLAYVQVSQQQQSLSFLSHHAVTLENSAWRMHWSASLAMYSTPATYVSSFCHVRPGINCMRTICHCRL